MKTIKTSELSGASLDWAVAKCEGRTWACAENFLAYYEDDGEMQYSIDWAQGGPVIEREGIGLLFDAGSACLKASWFATPDDQHTQESYEGECFDPSFMVDESAGMRGKTPLIAAMRCYVASQLGDTVEVPDELAVLQGMAV